MAFQKIDYAIGVKEMTAKRPTSEGGVTHTSLPFFLVTQTRNQKAPYIFKLTTLCNTVIKAEDYRPKMGLHNAVIVNVLDTFW
jgi:hypothetical protein